MKTHVVIATTEGYAYIQRITKEEAGVQSVICLDGTAQVLPVSSGYHAFVRRGSGIIARDFGHDAFRIDVDTRIDQGSSWQLPVYLAHALHTEGQLGNGEPRSGDRVFWATGEVDVDLAVRPVAGVTQKLAHAIAPVRELRERGINVALLLPSANVGESAGHTGALGAISGVTHLADVLPKASFAGQAVRPSSPHPYTDEARPPLIDASLANRARYRRWGLALLLATALLLGAALYLQILGLPSSREKSRNLDDFGGEGLELKERN